MIVEANTPTASDPTPHNSWTWSVDLERACGLLIGQCLGGMIAGPQITYQEVEAEEWLNKKLLSNGLEELPKSYDLSRYIGSKCLKIKISLLFNIFLLFFQGTYWIFLLP